MVEVITYLNDANKQDIKGNDRRVVYNHQLLFKPLLNGAFLFERECMYRMPFTFCLNKKSNKKVKIEIS